MIIETWVLPLIAGFNASLLRILRLSKLTRLSRMLRIIPELYYMMKGIVEASRSVACTILLLFVMLYVFGMILRQLSDGQWVGDTYFSSLPHAMWTLFVHIVLLDG